MFPPINEFSVCDWSDLLNSVCISYPALYVGLYDYSHHFIVYFVLISS
jgi:hypothetical protein